MMTITTKFKFKMEGPLLPRGKSLPSQETKKPVPHEHKHDNDVLFGKKTKKKRIASGAEKIQKKLKQDKEKNEKELTERKTPSLLTISRIKIGMKLLCTVKQLDDDKAVFSITNNLIVSIPWSEASDEHFSAFEKGKESPSPLSQIFAIGSFVRCIVVDVKSDDSHHIVRVSCRATLFNKISTPDPEFVAEGAYVYGTVKSVEDHGVVVNLGSKSISGFLPFSSVLGGKSLVSNIGRQIDGVVSSKPSKSVVNLKPLDSNFAPVNSTFLTIQPGILSEAKYVRGDLYDGGQLYSWNSFVCTSDWYHSGLNTFEEKKRTGRIIYVDPASRTLGISFLPHIKELTIFEFERKIGEIVEDAVISGVQSKLGITLNLPEPAFAHSSKLLDNTEHPSSGLIKETFSIGKTVPARIIDTSPFNGTYLVSLQPSVLKASVTSYESLLPGLKISGKVIKVDAAFGILVEIGNNIRGIVTNLHLSDSSNADTSPEGKFKIDQVCKGRVLSRENDRVSITLKKTLISSTLPILASYEDAAVNLITHGFITKVETFGLIITFYNKVHGLIPAHTLGASYVDNPSQYYRVSFNRIMLVILCTASQNFVIFHGHNSLREVQE